MDTIQTGRGRSPWRQMKSDIYLLLSGRRSGNFRSKDGLGIQKKGNSKRYIGILQTKTKKQKKRKQKKEPIQ